MFDNESSNRDNDAVLDAQDEEEENLALWFLDQLTEMGDRGLITPHLDEPTQANRADEADVARLVLRFPDGTVAVVSVEPEPSP